MEKGNLEFGMERISATRTRPLSCMGHKIILGHIEVVEGGELTIGKDGDCIQNYPLNTGNPYYCSSFHVGFIALRKFLQSLYDLAVEFSAVRGGEGENCPFRFTPNQGDRRLDEFLSFLYGASGTVKLQDAYAMVADESGSFQKNTSNCENITA